VDLTGKIINPPERFRKKTRIYLDSENITFNGKHHHVSGKVVLSIYNRELPYIYGDRIKVYEVRLRRPRNFNNAGAFDYVTYMKNRDIYVMGAIGNRHKIELIDKNNGNELFKVVYQLKDKMLKSFEAYLRKENAPIVIAMVLGEKGFLTRGDKELFLKSGTAHLMAVSGLHVGFVAFVSFWTIRKAISCIMARFFLEKALSGWIVPIAALSSIVPVIFYMLLVGWKPSCVRAGIMAIIYLFALASTRQKEIYRSIFIAAFIILMWKPLSFLDYGFQLSFMAILTIIFCYRELVEKNETGNDIPFQENKMVKIIRDNIAINLFATLGTSPLIFYYFNRITPYSLFSNILTIPLAVLIIPGSLISMMVFSISEWAGILALKIVSGITSLLMLAIKFFSELPFASLRFATPPLFAVVSFYILGIILIKLKRKIKMRYISIAAGGILCIFILFNYSPYPRGSILKVTFIDVSQGDAILIQLPDNKTLLVDGGGVFGNFDIGQSVLAPYLWDHGIEKIDYIIPTHSDNDHMEGLFYVLKEMKTGYLWNHKLIPFPTNIAALENLAHKKNIPIKYQNILLNNPNLKIERFHPTREFALNYLEKKENNFSTVFKLSYGIVSFLFASDIEKEAEAFLVKKYGDELHSTILKAPHHGSKTSSTTAFLKAVNPEVAVFPVGALNRYRHPSKQVINRYKKNNIRIFRTDLNGATTISTDGLKYYIETFIEGEEKS